MYKCPLGNFQPKEMDKEAVKQRGWNDDGILVVHKDDVRLDWAQRETVRQIGNQLYGEKGN